MICNKDCFHCRHPDCINDDYGPEELAMVIAFEEAGGIIFASERAVLHEEISEALVVQRNRARERRSVAYKKAAYRKKLRKRSHYSKPTVFDFYVNRKKG